MGNVEDIQKAHADMMHTMVSLNIVNQISVFDQQVTNNPLVRAIRQYMQIILEMLKYIRALRTGDWKLQADTPEVFGKYFFAPNKLNYARLTPVYLGNIKP